MRVSGIGDLRGRLVWVGVRSEAGLFSAPGLWAVGAEENAGVVIALPVVSRRAIGAVAEVQSELCSSIKKPLSSYRSLVVAVGAVFFDGTGSPMAPNG